MARNAETARAALDLSHRAGVLVYVPVVVLAGTLLGDERDARVNQVLKKLQLVEITESLARQAALLRRSAGLTGVDVTIDALVVAVSAAAGGGAILTADERHIGRLAGVAGTHIRPIRI